MYNFQEPAPGFCAEAFDVMASIDLSQLRKGFANFVPFYSQLYLPAV